MQDGEARIYVQQLRELTKSASEASAEVAASNGAWRESDEAELKFRQRMHAVVKLAHRLQETAGQAANKPTDEEAQLLLIGQTCMAIDLVLNAADGYVRTKHPAFLCACTDGERLLAALGSALE